MLQRYFRALADFSIRVKKYQHPLRRMILVSSPSNFFALFGRWTTVFLSDFLELNAILIGEISATSLVLAHACRFPLQKLAAVLIDMSFGVWFLVKLFMASLHLGAMTFKIRLFVDAQVRGYHSLSKRWSTTSAEQWVDNIIRHAQQDPNLPRKSNG